MPDQGFDARPGPSAAAVAGPGDDDAVLAARAVAWFTTSAALRAHRRVELGPGCVAVLDPRFPGSYEHNRLVVAASVRAGTLMAAADRVLGAAGLAHREIDVLGAVEPGDLAALAAAGYRHEAQVIMARPLTTADAADVPDDPVESVAESDVAAFVARMWRQEPGPDLTDPVIADLVGRRILLDRAGHVERLVVRRASAPGGPPEVLAAADLIRREATAELDGVWSDPAARGRGYGQALLDAAVRRAAQGGADVLLLVAAAEDWPRAWYARRGFVELGPCHAFTRPPGAG